MIKTNVDYLVNIAITVHVKKKKKKNGFWYLIHGEVLWTPFQQFIRNNNLNICSIARHYCTITDGLKNPELNKETH